MSSNEVNGIAGSPTAAPNPAGSFTAVNNSFTAVNTPPLPPPPARELSNGVSRASSLDSKMTSPALHRVEPRAYTSPYDTAAQNLAVASATPDPRSVPVTSAAVVSGQAPNAINSPTPTNGVLSREPSVARAHQSVFGPGHPGTPPQPQSSPPSQPAQVKALPESQSHNGTPSRSHVQLTSQQAPAQPPSRTQTPGSHHVSRSIAPHPSSRSSTPFAQDSNAPSIKPQAQQIAPAPAPAPTELLGPIHSMRIVPSIIPAGHPQAVQPPPAAVPVPAPQPVLKSQHVEVAPPHQPRPAIPAVELRLLQCEVLALLIQYLFPRPATPPDERLVISQIQNLWYLGEAMFRVELGPHYDICSRVLHAWLHERQSITSLRHSLLAQPGVSAAALMDRLLAMNDLRVMRLKWKNMSPLEGASPEDLLCRTFALLANTENTEHLFKDGLDRLNRGVFEFLRNEDAKIVMQRR